MAGYSHCGCVAEIREIVEARKAEVERLADRIASLGVPLLRLPIDEPAGETARRLIHFENVLFSMYRPAYDVASYG